MKENNKYVFAYDFLKKQVHKYYKQKLNCASQEEKTSLLSDFRDTLFGLETLSDPTIKELVENPQAHFYILHKLPIPRKLRQNNESSATPQDYQQVIKDLHNVGTSAQKMGNLRKKLQPVLILATLLSAGTALYAAKSGQNPKPAFIGSVAAFTLLVHNRKQNDLLPPYPKKTDIVR